MMDIMINYATIHLCDTLKELQCFFLMTFLLQLTKSEWAPDFGPATFVPSWGATVTGARKFLVAYNVNLLSTKEQAHRIALDIREQGRGKGQARYTTHLSRNLFIRFSSY